MSNCSYLKSYSYHVFVIDVEGPLKWFNKACLLGGPVKGVLANDITPTHLLGKCHTSLF